MSKLINNINKKFNTHKTEVNDISLTEKSSGKVRQMNGKFVENIVSDIFKSIIDGYGITNYTITNGKCDVRKIKHELGGCINVCTDLHIKVNNVSFFIECKSYIDGPMLKRTGVDFLTLKDNNPKNNTIIFNMEKSAPDENCAYYINSKIVDRMFYILDRNRDSKKPYWRKDNWKNINNDKLSEFIDYIKTKIKSTL